jgi:Na+-driven multidrug efflux pump
MRLKKSSMRSVKKSFVREMFFIALGTLPLAVLKGAPTFTNAVLLSRVGNTAGNATTLVQSLVDLLMNTCNAPLQYICTAAGQLNDNGQGPGQHATVLLKSGAAMSFLVVIPQVLVGVFSAAILRGLGQSQDEAQYAQSFFDYYVISMPLSSLVVVANQFFMGFKKVHYPVLTQAIGVLFYGSSVGVIMASHPTNQEKMAGAGQALVVFSGTTCLASLVVLCSRASHFGIRGQGGGESDEKQLLKENFSKMLKNGLPLFIVTLSEVGILSLVNFLVGHADTENLRPQLVLTQYQDILLMFSSAMATATQIQLANNSKDKRAVVETVKNGLLLAMIIPTIYLLIALSAQNKLADPFLSVEGEEAIVDRKILSTNKLFIVSAINSIVMGFRFVATSALMGLDKIDLKLVLNMFSTWLGIIFGVILERCAGLHSILAYNLGLTFGFSFSAILQGNHLKQVVTAIPAQLLAETEYDPPQVIEVDVPLGGKSNKNSILDNSSE